MLECKKQQQWQWQQHLQWKMERPGEREKKNKENIAEMKTNQRAEATKKKSTRKYKNKSKNAVLRARLLRHIWRV